MFASDSILRLYTDVMYRDVVNHCIKDLDILKRLNNMEGVYSRGLDCSKVIDFNSVENRCAYLHKYAPLYTAIVKDIMLRILSDETLRFRFESRTLRMCSLGGGPGTDVVGVLGALDSTFGSSQWCTFVSIVDTMAGWKSTFRSIVNELRKPEYLSLAPRFSDESFSWKYVEGDLLDAKKYNVWDAMTYSSIVTVIKCLSMFRSKDVPMVIERIFRAMSFGSFVLIIDDAVERLAEITLSIAQKHQLIPVFNLLRETNYSFDELKVTRFGHTSCYQASVTSLMLLKPVINPRSFIVSNLQSLTPRLCVSCRNLIYVCPKCPQGFQKPLCSSFQSSTNDSRPSWENEFKTPFSSRSLSPIRSSTPSANMQFEMARKQYVTFNGFQRLYLCNANIIRDCNDISSDNDINIDCNDDIANSCNPYLSFTVPSVRKAPDSFIVEIPE